MLDLNAVKKTGSEMIAKFAQLFGEIKQADKDSYKELLLCASTCFFFCFR